MIFEEAGFGCYSEAERKVRRAFRLYEDGRMLQALDALEKALDINPSNDSWHFNKALTLDAVNRFDDAINEYEIALQLSPGDLEILNSLAVDYTRTGQYDRAIDTFEQIQQLDSDFEPCYCNRIITYTEMGQHELAEQMFYLAQQIKPNCALCYYNIGNSLFARGQYKRAVRCWLKTAELEPTHPEINHRIAQAYWSDGDSERAHEYFLTELRNNPGDVDIILDFGLFLLEAGDIESAKEKFNRILELKPDSGAALFYLGEIAFDNADYPQAVKLFNQSLQEDNTLPGPRYRLAQYALTQGQKQEARNYLLTELTMDPEDSDILVSMGSMFLAISEPDYATHCLLRAVDMDYASADGYYYLGLARATKGCLDDAAEFFEHALDIRPKDVRILRDSAVVYLAMGRLVDARERIEKARSLAGDDRQLRTLENGIRLAKIRERIVDSIRQLPPRFVSDFANKVRKGHGA